MKILSIKLLPLCLMSICIHFKGLAQWSHMVPDFGGDTTFQPVIYMANQDVGYIVTGIKGGEFGVLRSCALYKTTNGGLMWSRLSNNPVLSFTYGIDGIGPDTLIAGLQNDRTIRSFDGGQTWDTIFTKSGTPYIFSHNTVLLATDTGWYFSGDLGDTWEFRSPGFSLFNTTLLSISEAVAFNYQDKGFYKSSDTAKTWIPVGNYTGNIISGNYNFYPVNSEIFFMLAEGKLSKSLDAGANWQFVDSFGNSTSEFNDGLYFINGKDGFVVNQGILYKTNDSGNTWCKQPSLANYFLSDHLYNWPMTFVDDSIGFWVGAGGSKGIELFKTTNQGGPACPSGPGVSIRNAGNDGGITVYPNPAVSFVVVESERESLAKICLYNLTGQKVVEVNAQGQRSEIPVSGLCAGIYLIEVRGSSGSVYRNKVLVQ